MIVIGSPTRGRSGATSIPKEGSFADAATGTSTAASTNDARTIRLIDDAYPGAPGEVPHGLPDRRQVPSFQRAFASSRALSFVVVFQFRIVMFL